MNLLGLLFSVLITALLSFNIFAGDSSSGCGLGWEVAPKNSLLSSTTRNTTHVFLPNTFSMTFGTSNCAKHSIVKNDKKGIHYAEANFDQLMREMAMGNGEFIAAFASVMGCDDSAAFGQVMQKNYLKIYSSDGIDAIEMYRNVKKQIKQNTVLSKKCSLM